ncbi:MAG: cytidyltransferase [Lachnospiraceae bacterium]|nr:cytidyltransferase [Lachnospiraceae bacterium]
MKIVAVIPARAGSKGIPNKNIRIIGEHPLIYYAINNAKNSEYITDIIVSTDSPEVELVARQMGVEIRQRDKALCGDSITLDSVIYDAVKDIKDADYIITMQPTSPTLKVKTLDGAIRYALEKDIDTLISAINAPHLTWGEKDGKKVPNYTKRLNRQYLPPCYVETGAFVISKAGIVTETTRIGQKVDVYELAPEEAQDIDTFEDMRNAEMALKRQRVGMYVNGNNKRGTGHIYRALEVADEFYVKPDIYYDINQTDPKVFGNTMHRLIPVDGIAQMFEKCRENDYTIFVNDILDTSIDYMIGLRSVLPNAKIVNFEDDGEGILKADLVFNALYSKSPATNVYSGEKYYIAGKTFLFFEPIEIRGKVKRVFISFGGADPKNYTDRLLRMISKPEYAEYEFEVVLGRAKENVDELLKYNDYSNINVYHDVKNMPEIMSACDMGITSRGRTGYELAILGIPTIAMAQNEREEKHSFVCNENGFSYLGLGPSDEIIESNLKMYLSLSRESRQAFQDKLLSHELKGGRRRIMGLINSI